MFMDIKLNYNQLTEKKLKNLINRYNHKNDMEE